MFFIYSKSSIKQPGDYLFYLLGVGLKGGLLKGEAYLRKEGRSTIDNHAVIEHWTEKLFQDPVNQ